MRYPKVRAIVFSALMGWSSIGCASTEISEFLSRGRLPSQDLELVGCLVLDTIGGVSDGAFLSLTCDWDFDRVFPEEFRVQMVDVVSADLGQIDWSQLGGKCVELEGLFTPYVSDLEDSSGVLPSGWLLSRHGILEVRVARELPSQCASQGAGAR